MRVLEVAGGVIAAIALIAAAALIVRRLFVFLLDLIARWRA